MKLLDTSGGNTKLRKNNKPIEIRVAGLSLYPNDFICPSGNPLEHNCVLNTIESDYFLEPVSVLEIKEMKDE